MITDIHFCTNVASSKFYEIYDIGTKIWSATSDRKPILSTKVVAGCGALDKGLFCNCFAVLETVLRQLKILLLCHCLIKSFGGFTEEANDKNYVKNHIAMLTRS